MLYVSLENLFLYRKLRINLNLMTLLYAWTFKSFFFQTSWRIKSL